ncbi:ankyrin repeat domain-containing protein [Marinobacter lutaoensis]|jgi:ankyrin repeat protein|uniref:Ankryin n=1 Tax=Marinobacter lutaoensis TaxID=135739 RepID=A0A1V2DSA9_9GAMM|nr:ankyrin repeat domain-containing protein [Marinobacter lutaoensis]MBE02341.1 ankryin [Marinobacter sp.]NVD35886.1 ankyrin repeat domain-containing protein [Marinobacter lutaoensis]ONF43568.1 ankryin [Marinobacter lutaoensis]|tara:strand:+ start:76 stop:768 length:693 start_codon:yes stop_codon:yes gene_type:complete
MAQGYGAARSPFVVVSLLVLLSACVAARTPSNLARTTATEAGTPLMAAAASGDLERVRGLAESGHPLNALTERGTPLMAAVRAGRDRVAWYLLTQGADPDLASANGETPLMAASAAGRLRLVQLLLSAGADVNARDRAGYTPVVRAAEQGQVSVVKTLVSAGANVNVQPGGESLLMKIVGQGDLLMAEMLLAAGADVHFRAADGGTALQRARALGYPDLDMLLIQAGARD